jgi:esterase/lipase
MDGDTPITITVKEVLLGVAALLVGAWAVLSFTFGNTASDVSDIKNRLTAAQAEARAVENKGMDADADFRQALNNIDKNVAVMVEQTAAFQGSIAKSLDTIQANVASVSGSVDKLFTQLEAMNIRLVRIEERITAEPMKLDDTQPSPGQSPSKLEPMPLPQPQ